MEIIFAITIAVVLWYFGSTLGRGAETLNSLADTRLEDLEADQIVTSAKRRVKTSKRAQKLLEKNEAVLSNAELREMFKQNKEEE